MPRKKPTITSVTDKDYFSIEEIIEFIPGSDFASRKQRSDIYKLYEGRLCEKVDLSNWINTFETKKEKRLLKINCLKNIHNGCVIFMEHDKVRYIIYHKGNKHYIKSPIHGLSEEAIRVKSFNFAMNLCISKMI